MATTNQDGHDLSTRQTIALLLIACAVVVGFVWVLANHPTWLFWPFCIGVLIWIVYSPGALLGLILGFWIGS